MIADKPAANSGLPLATEAQVAFKGKSRAPGVLLGVFLFFFAAVHALPGAAAASYLNGPFAIWSATVGWLIAAGGMSLAAYGLWGFPGLAKRWRSMALFGAIASFALLMISGQWNLWPMMVLDGVVVSVAVDGSPLQLPNKKRGLVKRFAFFVVRLLAMAFWLYAATVVATRPIEVRWGATDRELASSLPGDQPESRANVINHVVTVNAPAEKVWPWLVQMGQDKAGFYSYDFLEQAIGAKIHNTYEIRPEWQNLKAGDFIWACPPDYFGGRFGKLGWYVTDLKADRYMVLRHWGPFWLEPQSNGSTRFGVRTEMGSVPMWAAPINVFGFEPAHFIMEQKMLLTVKSLAERP